MRTTDTAPPAVRPAAMRIGRLHAALARIRHDLLTELAAFDEDELWQVDGATDMVSWLTYELGLLPRNARAWLDVARRLHELPELRARLAAGELSLDQVRALGKIATPDNEAELADLAAEMTAAEVERMARKSQEISREQLREEEPKHEVTFYWHDDQRFFHLEGNLAAAEGALVERALLRLAAQEGPDPGAGIFRMMSERAADALTQMASAALGRDVKHHRPTVVVHVSAEHLAAGAGPAVIENGPVIAIDVARRLACKCDWLVTLDGPDGTPIGIGRRSRRIPAWLERAVNKRDRGCRYPGCGRTRWTNVHHIIHWILGGRTDLENLITLCTFHHRMLHNRGWDIRGNPNGQVEWITPSGRVKQALRRLPQWDAAIQQLVDEADRNYEARIAQLI